MPPQQCPECGRFLEDAFVDAMDAADASCPRCQATPDNRMFAEKVAIPAGGSSDEGPASAEEISVRPPDLEPDAVRDRTPDVLAGWDAGAGDAEVASWRNDRRPFPTDTVVVLGAGVAGLVLGALIGSSHRGRGAALGTLGGLVGSAVTRRVWLLRS